MTKGLGVLRKRALLSVVLAGLCAMASPSLAAGAIPFAVTSFEVNATSNGLGEAFTQAGGHPYELTTTIEFATEEVPVPGTSSNELVPTQDPRDIAVALPAGTIGDPLAVSRCPLAVFDAAGSQWCPATSQVGTAELFHQGIMNQDSVYNLEPPPGRPAELGITTVNVTNFTIVAGVRPSEGYRLYTESRGTPEVGLYKAKITIWGVPAEPIHNPLRGRDCSELDPKTQPGVFTCYGLSGGGERAGGEASNLTPLAFLTMPTRCTGGPLEADVAADSWQQVGPVTPDGGPDLSSAYWKKASAYLPALTGCGALVFHPTIEVQPQSAAADAPTGLHVNLDVPQTNSPGQNATPQLKEAVVTLPPGMSLSPGAGYGLEACSDAQFAKTSSAAAGCPEKSQVGTVEVESPLLSHPLKGDLFVGEPLCGNAAHPNPCGPSDATGGNLFRLFLQARGEGVTVKLPGAVSVNQATGQLTTTFAEDPQLPFEHLRLHIEGGPQATLANPQSCAGMPTGPGGLPLAMTTSDLMPWSAPETPDATPQSGFEVSGCAASMPFAPAFTAGMVTPKAGAFTPFTLTFSRHDGEQDLSGLQLTTPPGLVGMLSKVPLCGEPQAQAGTCSAASQIGTAHVASGAGSAPLWLAGPVYLTGPYNGAPFGLSIVVPAVAGPFNLGNVVVRSAINIDPNTSALTITSGPLPQLIDGVQTRIKTVNVTVDRPGFMFNPTNCKAQQITGTIAAAQGGAAHVSSPFAAGGCGSLPFKPKFQVSTSAKHSKKNGAGLHVVVQSGAGQANIGSVHVSLPKVLPSRLDTLKQACPAAVFNANPASCPAGSKVGGATAHTPVLPVGLTGPAYFVSHGGAAFPDLDVVLQGDGVTVILTGNTFISKAGITTSTFATVPDVPITRFDLNLPTGAHSALAGNGSFCKGAMYMPTTIKGQNGALVKQKTKIAVTGCPKPKKKAKKARKAASGHNGSRRAK